MRLIFDYENGPFLSFINLSISIKNQINKKSALFKTQYIFLSFQTHSVAYRCEVKPF